MQRPPAAHGLHCEPPQSTSVSCPLRRPSEQLAAVGKLVGAAVGAIDVGARVGTVGCDVGIAVVGIADGAGVGVAVDALHSPENMPPISKLHTLLVQSLSCLHFWPPSQPKQSGPPQSISVSRKLTSPSKQASLVGTAVGLNVGKPVG